MKRSATVKCSISAELKTTALVQTYFPCLLEKGKGLEVDCDKYHLKKGVLADNTSLLTSLGCGVSRYL